MYLSKDKKKYFALLFLIVFVVILIPQHQVHAACPLTPSDCILGIIEWSNAAMLESMGQVIAWSADLLESVVLTETQAVITNTPIVYESWKIIRDFVNMFFILILILMAFGTIFDLKKYDWRNLLFPFLTAALLINFSFAIGTYIIDIGNGLTSVFLKQISGFSSDLANGFSIQKTLPDTATTGQAFAAITNGSVKLLITSIFSNIFLITALFSFLSALVFALVRIPVLWFLLILSPIAWISYTLPNLKSQIWDKWWKWFISWVFFLPTYMFFIMFAVIFLRSKQDISLPQSSSFIGTFTGPAGALNDLFFYVLTLMFMIGGLVMSFKIGSLAGNGAGKTFGAIQGGIKHATRKITRYDSLKAGISETGKKIQEEGLPGIYGGAQAERMRAARIGERLQTAIGFKPGYKAQEQFSEKYGTEYTAIREQYQRGQIKIDDIRREAQQNADTPKGFAYQKMLAEMGQLDAPSTFNTLKSSRNNPLAAEDFVKTASKAKFLSVPSADIREMAAADGSRIKQYEELGKSTGYIPARREMYKYIQANSKVASGLTKNQFEKGIEIFGGSTTTDGSSFLNDIAKARPDLAVDYQVANPLPGPTETRKKLMAGHIKNAKPADLANMPYAEVWNNIDFQQALSDRLQVKNKGGRKLKNTLNVSIRNSGRYVAEKQEIVTKLSKGGAARP